MCEYVARRLGKKWAGETTASNLPYGCLEETGNMRRGMLFNVAQNGVASPEAGPVCSQLQYTYGKMNDLACLGVTAGIPNANGCKIAAAAMYQVWRGLVSKPNVPSGCVHDTTGIFFNKVTSGVADSDSQPVCSYPSGAMFSLFFHVIPDHLPPRLSLLSLYHSCAYTSFCKNSPICSGNPWRIVV